MSYKPDEATLMAYLYDELAGAEKKKVEKYLSENPEAKTELDGLSEARNIIGHFSDHEVEVPRFTFENPSKVVVASSQNFWWRIPLGIAASIALVMIMGYLTSFNVSTNGNGVQIAFGKADQNEVETFSKDQVEQMINSALEQNNKLVSNQLQDVKNDLVSQVGQVDPGSLDEELLRKYIAQLRRYNAETIAGLLEESESSQRKYTDQVIQDLAIYLDLQRQDDLELIQARLDNISDNAERYNRQTGQIITSLLSDQTQNENQY